MLSAGSRADFKLDISNVIPDLSSLDDSNGKPRQTIENLTKLGNLASIARCFE